MATLTSAPNPADQNPSVSNYLFILHQISFALTFSFTITSFALAYVYQRGFASSRDTEPTVYFTYWYFFLRSGVKFNTFFGQEPQSLFGMTIALLSVVSGIALLLVFAFHSLAKTRLGRIFFDPISGALIFLSFPVGILLAPDFDPRLGLLDKQGMSAAWVILLFIAMVCGTLYLTRKWIFPIWKGLIFLSVYYVLMICLNFIIRSSYGERGWIVLQNVTQLSLLNIAFIVVGPCAGLAWMLHARETRQGIWQKPMWPRRQIFLLSFPWLLFSIIPWLSLGTRSISHLPDSEYVNISLKRGHCYGSCPIYTVVLNSQGSANYFGEQFVRTKGPERATVSKEKVQHLLESFDNEHFFAIEDKAFPICFDAPSTSITVTIGLYSKTVTGDSCYGASWPKSGLLKLGEEIDDAVGSRQWVECRRNECVWH